MCSSTQLTCGSQLWPPTTQSSVRTCTPIQDGNTFIASQIPEPLNVISRLHPKKLVKAMELQGFSCRTIFNFISESSVLGMRTMFSSASVTYRTFVSFPRSMCNAEFLQTILDLVLQLVDLILILELLCLLHHSINYGLRQLPSSHGMAIQSDLSWAYTF